MKIILSLLVLAAVVVSGAVYLLIFSPSQAVQDVTTQDFAVNQTTRAGDISEEFSGVGTLTDLKNKNVNLECSFTYTPNEFESDITGTYFVAGGNVRGDFVTSAPEMGGDILTSLIVDENTVYIWSDIDGQLFGTKTKIIGSEPVEIQTPVEVDVPVRYSCKPWTEIDSSVFVPPSSVLFKDTEAVFESGMEYGTVYEEGEF